MVFNRGQLRYGYYSDLWYYQLSKEMEKKKLRFGLFHYSKPTPKRMRRLGDALLIVSTLFTNEVMIEKPAVASVAMITGVVGKFLTNFFSEQ